MNMKLKVDPIKFGTVIDHIPAGTAFKLVDILNLSNDDQIMIGTNLVSVKMGKKDLIKIENRELTPEQVNSIAIIARGASFSIIRNGESVQKTKVELPKVINKIIKCPNENCIMVKEGINSNFEVFVNVRGIIKFCCKYCEKVFSTEQIIKYINI